MIKHVRCDGLNKRVSINTSLNEDINIVVGKNGSGKTTFLKLLWYAISGNIERIPREVPFEYFRLEGDRFWLDIQQDPEGKKDRITVKWDVGQGQQVTTRGTRAPLVDFDQVNRQICRASGASVFFPTFRRIEGGFSIGQDSPAYRTYEGVVYAGPNASLASAMNELSSRLAVGKHHFVASIATDDIVKLLTTRYADVSEKTNRLHTDLSQWILRTIRNASGVPQDSDTDPQSILEEIRKKADDVAKQTEALLRPFSVLSTLIARIFDYGGIRCGDAITLGEASDAIGSNLLSAGEKQMLSFLCYNAFAIDSCVFIDEPEISLHVDWQRTLFPTLLSQATGNQFFVATHSPFIYSKYSDKELVLNVDLGDSDATAHAN